jgi:hypothetical protein
MNKCILIRGLLFPTLLFLLSFSRASAANETLTTGAFIINMGVLPQSIANGLKPYGLIYDLIKNYNVPIKWVINPAKLKDGIDFTYNGIDYTGGTFIIPAEYRSATVNARIAFWQTQGVIGVTTTAPVTVPVYTSIQVAPVWVLDAQNGSIAQGYLTNAGIPATAYSFRTPAQLDCCNDLFVMPHADPTWATHSNLLTWNKTCKGAIWAACHAVSVLESLSNPLDATQKMNFLSTPNLVPFGAHANGTPPYSYNFPTDPIMQFVGPIDAAQQGGSEQIYLPALGGSWRPGAKVGVYDPSQANVPSLSPGLAASLVYGYGFDDPTRGKVMYEGGHSHDKGTVDDVAAQRTFLNFSFVTAIEKVPVPDPTTALVVGNTLSSGIPAPFTFSLPAPFNIADYTIQWTTSCGGTFSPSSTQQSVSYTPPSVVLSTPCLVSVRIEDACGRKITNSASFNIVCGISVTPTAINPTCTTTATGIINYTATGGVAPYNYNWTRGATTGSGTGTTISGLIAGTYNVTITSSNGCSTAFTQTLTDPSPLSITAISTNISCNGAATGAIDLTASGGTTPYTYNWGGGITIEDRTGLLAGTYTPTVTDAKGCIQTITQVLTELPPLSINTVLTPILCKNGTTGAINTTVTGGTSPYTYNWGGGVTTQNRTTLAAGAYTLTVTDANNCTKTATAILTQPAAALALSTSVTNINCGSGTGAINLTPAGGTTPYTYNWGGGVITEDRTSLLAGTYTVTVTDANNCTATTSATITQTSALSLSTSITQILCFGGVGAINLTPSGATPYTYAWADGVTTEDRTALTVGTYSVTVSDANGCTASTSETITTPSVILAVTATMTNVNCNGGTTGAINITASGGTTPYTYNWGGGITTEDRAALAAGTYTVTVTDANNCTVTLSKTITQPTALSLSTLITQVTCVGGTDGAVDLSVTGGTSPYTYAWAGGTTTQDRTGLGAGTYTVTVTDANSCTATISAVLTAQNAAPNQASAIRH